MSVHIMMHAYRILRCIPHRLDRFSEFGHSATGVISTPNGTFSDRPRRHISNAALVGTETLLAVEHLVSENRCRGCGTNSTRLYKVQHISAVQAKGGFLKKSRRVAILFKISKLRKALRAQHGSQMPLLWCSGSPCAPR